MRGQEVPTAQVQPVSRQPWDSERNAGRQERNRSLAKEKQAAVSILSITTSMTQIIS